MSEKFILSSSNKDLHGINFSRTMLEEGVLRINGQQKMRYLVNHRREYPLLGYIDNAELIEREDTYLLIAERILYSKKENIDWDSELLAEKPDQPITILRRGSNEQDFVITLDPNNFGSPKQYFNIEQTLRETIKDDLHIKTDTRKSFSLEPRVIISLLAAGPIWNLSKPFLKKIGERIADNIGDAVYDAGKKQLLSIAHNVKKLMTITRQQAIPVNKPLSLIFELHGEPYIELHAKTDNADLVVKGLSINQLSKMRQRVNELSEHVKIAEAHFDLSKKGSWAFTYLVAIDGTQIGKKSIFKKRDQLMKRIELNPQYGHSIGADVTYEYHSAPADASKHRKL
jgi:hypothetical protein